MRKTTKTRWYSLSVDTVHEMLGTKKQGLTTFEATKRLERDGFNELPAQKQTSPFFLFLKQFIDPFIIILMIACGISWFIGHRLDALIIGVVLLVNALIGFTQEWRAEKSILALKQMVRSWAKVYRDATLHKIDASRLVIGDVVDLVAGDIVPADIRLTEEHNCSTQEAVLTGESESQIKNIDAIEKQDCILAEQDNMVFMGSFVVRGKATGVVVAVGINTEIGSISEDIQKAKTPTTKFQHAIRTLGTQILAASILTGIVIFGIGIERGKELNEMFLLTLATIVSLIPEGLPAVVSIVLAIGVYRMSRQNVIVRKLPSAETCGSVSIICTDKTGTLTKGEMMTQQIVTRNRTITVSGDGFTPKGFFTENGRTIDPLSYGEVTCLLEHAAHATDAHLEQKHDNTYSIIGDPTEGALVVVAAKAGIQRIDLHEGGEDVVHYPFDSQYRYSGNYTKKRFEAKGVLSVAGAYEDVIQKSTLVYDRGTFRTLQKQDKKYFERQHSELSMRGLRVVSIAFRLLKKHPVSQEEAVQHMVFVGLCGMIDSPREGIQDAIQKARQAGVRILMITGDHADTAAEIAKQVGVVKSTTPPVIKGSEIEDMSDQELRSALANAAIIARATPRSKLRIVETLQKQGEIVAMTGDGVNDAPALQQADIGIAMGITGTDVSREASQMVLMDDNFSSIIDAMEEGRVILRNMRQTIAFLLTTSVGQGVIILSGLLIHAPLVLLPIQILFLNLVTGGLTDVALAMEGNHHDTMQDKRLVKNTKLLTKDIIPYGIIVVALMSICSLLIFFHYLPDVDKARTMAFVSIAFFQFWSLLSMRSLSLSVFQLGFFSNRYIVVALLFSIGLVVAMVHSGTGQSLFSTVPLTLNEWLFIVAVSSSVFIAGEIWKGIRKLFYKNN
ncbi:MAG: HAD-IC family P-type ATPase [Candidatus Spechtbacteria bacterium SB0662_bin_43]|uniref:HAD-IC family P-type ATPase n=1 Tax=Candidatus Spechtbacteria bacterium SB0662_bin_43 TaxID=2604897 RepID=A0A845DBE1_9BACT|nr:HAD-IC family P-type ATPase [Candidatus Spechtbacteria bacterium SB0662_bin_43]